MSFKPDSTYERHQKYIGAFSDPQALNNITIYFAYITRFINDGSIHYSDDDDMQIFRDLLFESSWGRVHIRYYEYILDKWTKFALNQSITVLSKYINFLEQISNYYMIDLFHEVFKHTAASIMVPGIFNLLSSESKVIFIKVGMTYPDIIKQIPKFKTYLLFS